MILSRITLGELIAFYTFMTRLIFPMVALGFVTNIFQRGGASMGRLNYILDSEPKISDANVTRDDGGEIRGEIEFRDLTFTYPTVRSDTEAAKSNGTAAINKPVLTIFRCMFRRARSWRLSAPRAAGNPRWPR